LAVRAARFLDGTALAKERTMHDSRTRHRISSPTSAVLALGLISATAAGCMEGPYDGQVVAGTTVGRSFHFSGVYADPNIAVTVQVLDQPDTAPHWVDLITTTTGPTPQYYPDNSSPFNAYYAWSADAVPVPSAALLERWPQGGLVRTRAIAKGSHPSALDVTDLAIADEDGSDCVIANSNSNWAGIVVACGKDPTYGAAIASNSPTPADPFAGHTVPGYLGFLQYKGPGGVGAAAAAAQQAETVAYYNKIGAPPTLPAFRQAYGFDANPGAEVVTKYYNDGDLGIGREMHCVSLGGQLSCYVRNFAPTNSSGDVLFGDQTGSLAIVTGGGAPFATVAMHYNPPGSQDNAVTFMVYGTDDKLKSDNAKLDVKQANTDIPGNCLTCHGGAANYDPGKHAVTGTAHFLPFDVFNALKYGTGSFSYASQAEQFRKLNAMVAAAGASPGIAEYVNGLYGNQLNTPNQPAVSTFVPAAWSGDAVQKKLYTSVVAPYCRTCHLAMTDATNQHLDIDWTSYAEFTTQSNRLLIGLRVCGTKEMPNAEHTSRNFWNSSARAHLTGTLGLITSCNPQ
jgi:hypothetical protein